MEKINTNKKLKSKVKKRIHERAEDYAYKEIKEGSLSEKRKTTLLKSS